MITRRARKQHAVVAGGGAVEMEISAYLSNYALTIQGKQQLIIGAFAKALEVIPRQLADNSGFDSTDILNKLRQKHLQPDGRWFGVDVENEGICDTFQNFVWEPTLIRSNAFQAATEAACVILSVDETIKYEKNEQGNSEFAQRAGRGRGIRR